jgi:phosphohistidine phosphatase
MKKIILVRHGKAEDPASGISDFERSLTIKGKIISRLMARKLKETENTGMHFISSPAFRAFETAMIFAGEFGIDAEQITISSNLYYKMNMRYLQEMLSQISEKNNTMILFGHNPSFTEIASGLSRDGCDFIPKSGIVGISFAVNTWNEITQKSGQLEYDLKPERVL